jgi:hypothetical protein
MKTGWKQRKHNRTSKKGKKFTAGKFKGFGIVSLEGSKLKPVPKTIFFTPSKLTAGSKKSSIMMLRDIPSRANTSLQGYMPEYTTYPMIVEVFGEPIRDAGDKSDKEWVGIINGKIFTIYNYKTGSAYFGPGSGDGTDLRGSDWHVGGPDRDTAIRVINHFNRIMRRKTNVAMGRGTQMHSVDAEFIHGGNAPILDDKTKAYINKKQNELDKIERFVKKSVSVLDYEDWEWDGEVLKIMTKNGIEYYTKKDLEDEGVL